MAWGNPFEARRERAEPSEMIDTWIELAWQDGSLGWIGIANLPSAAACAAYLPDEGFEEVFTAHGNRVTVGGQFFPNGLGETVDGGYRLTGAWNFGSGTGHSEYVAAGFIPTVDGEMVTRRRRHPAPAGGGHPPRGDRVHRRLARAGAEGDRFLRLQRDRPVRPGGPDLRTVHPDAPPGRRRRVSAWGSSPSPRPATPRGPWGWPRACSTTSPSWPPPRCGWATRRRSPTGHLPAEPVPPPGHVEGRPPAGGDHLPPTSNRPSRTARRSPRPCGPTCGWPPPSPPRPSREIVQWAHLAAGTSAIREGSRLERAFRDMYTGTQHVFIGEKTYTDAAQIYLGLVDDQLGM